MADEPKRGVDASEDLHALLKNSVGYGDLTRAFQDAVDDYLQSEAFAQHLKDQGITDLEAYKPRRER